MSQATEDENIASLLGAVIGLQTFCAALAGALPKSLSEIVASNLSLTISPLKKELEGMPCSDPTIEATLRVLESVHTALLQSREAGLPPSAPPRH